MTQSAVRHVELRYKDLDITNISAAWRYIAKHNGQFEGKRDSHLRRVTPML